MDHHRSTVAAIAADIKRFHARGEQFRIYHGHTNSTRPSEYRRSNTVDTSKLTNVLHVDVARRTALVEPNVPMDKLVAATVTRGFIPPVAMEVSCC